MTKIQKYIIIAIIFLIPLQLGIDTGHDPSNHKTINAVDFVLVFAFFNGIPKGLNRKKIKLTSKIFYPGVIFIIWAFLSMLLVSEWKIASGFGVLSCIRALFIGYYIANSIKSQKDIDLIIRMLIYSLLFICIIGTLQYYLHSSLGLGIIGSWGMRPEKGFLRATGTFQVPNVFAAYMIFLIPLVLSYFLFGTKKKNVKMLYLGILVIAMFSVILTYSRSAWLGFVFSMLMYISMFIKNPKLQKRIIPILFGVGIIAGVVIFQFADEIAARTSQATRADRGIEHRFKAFDELPQVVAKVPIFGTGQWAALTVAHRTVHVTLLRILVELGIPGLLFFLWILKDIYVQSFKIAKTKNRYFSSLAIAIVCGYTAFMILSCFNPTYRFFSPRNLFWLLAGVLLAIKRLDLYYKKLALYQKRKKFEEFKNKKEEEKNKIDTIKSQGLANANFAGR